jgi:hypothetical protein
VNGKYKLNQKPKLNVDQYSQWSLARLGQNSAYEAQREVRRSVKGLLFMRMSEDVKWDDIKRTLIGSILLSDYGR